MITVNLALTFQIDGEDAERAAHNLRAIADEGALDLSYLATARAELARCDTAHDWRIVRATLTASAAQVDDAAQEAH